MTSSARVNATAAALATYSVMPEFIGTEKKIATAAAVGGAIHAFPESQQLAVRTGVSFGSGLVIACKLMPESTTLKGMAVTSLIAGLGTFMGLMYIDQLAQNTFATTPVNTQGSTTNFQAGTTHSQASVNNYQAAATTNGQQTFASMIPTFVNLWPASLQTTQMIGQIFGGPLPVQQQAAMEGHRVQVGNQQNNPQQHLDNRNWQAPQNQGPQTVAQTAQQQRVLVGNNY